MALGRDELLAMHDVCAAVRRRILDTAQRSVVQGSQVTRVAALLGLPGADELAQVPEEDLAFALDLALHDAPPGRPRPLDRLLRQQARRAAGESVLVLRALETSWFSVFRVLGPHPEAGFLLGDAMLGGEAWVLDALLEERATEGTVLATRLGRVQGFAMTSGVVAVLDDAMLAGLRQAVDASGLGAEAMMAEPRVAALAYRHAIGLGVGDLLGHR
jgi:hypothetical protein